QIERRQRCGRQVRTEALDVELGDRTRREIRGGLARGVRDRLAAAVRQREGQDHVLVVGARAAQFVERIADDGREAVDVAERGQADAVVEDLGALVDQELAQQLHQTGDLGGRARSVLR